jgi:hypothetical protein
MLKEFDGAGMEDMDTKRVCMQPAASNYSLWF